MLLKFSDFDLSNGVNSTDFVPTDRKPKIKHVTDFISFVRKDWVKKGGAYSVDVLKVMILHNLF